MNDAFPVVRRGLKAMEDTRRQVQQEQFGHCGRKQDPGYRIRNMLCAGSDKLTHRRIARLEAALEAGVPNYEVTLAWRCYQQLRTAYATKSLREGNKIALQMLAAFHTAAPKPSTASLNSTAASPAASATRVTTDSA